MRNSLNTISLIKWASYLSLLTVDLSGANINSKKIKVNLLDAEASLAIFKSYKVCNKPFINGIFRAEGRT